MGIKFEWHWDSSCIIEWLEWGRPSPLQLASKFLRELARKKDSIAAAVNVLSFPVLEGPEELAYFQQDLDAALKIAEYRTNEVRRWILDQMQTTEHSA